VTRGPLLSLALAVALVLLPLGARAWEEERALAWIVAHSPLLQAQRAVTQAHQPPGGLRRVLERTSVYARAASGTASTVSDGGETTTSDPLTVGIQVTIPLASPRERREFAQQALAESVRVDQVRNRALTDLAQLRELEAERVAVQTRLDFYQSKADWLQERIAKGYEGDVGALWDVAQKQNAEAAAVRRLDLLIDAQRRQVAHHAGDRWEPLFDYLAARRPLPE
jgi:hypothetical protein